VVHELDQHVTARASSATPTTLLAEIDALDPIGALPFVNHFPNGQLCFEHERERQDAARFIETRALERPAHVMVAGDFDADPSAASLRFWTGRQSLGGLSVCYCDAWESAHPSEPGHTYTPGDPLMASPAWPFRRIDYILVRAGDGSGPSLAIEACELIFAEPVNGIHASDHYGLMADLVLPRGPV
jgi:endonuclease/exonuclease/phosphatase family metal-dependent hydrolase